MLEIRWHSRAGQGAVTGAKGLADVIAQTGKYVQAFAVYGSAKRGAAMAAYDRIDDSEILNHEKYMVPDFVLAIDPQLPFVTDITVDTRDDTKYIITTHLSKNEFLKLKPEFKGKDVYVLDCVKISIETIGKSVPNAPMLGALVKVSNIMDIEGFIESFLKVLGKKLPQKIIDANRAAILRAYNEVN